MSWSVRAVVFFQAEGGIRDGHVTGVQTCALPIWLGRACREGAKAMGLELFSPDEDRSAVVTAIRAPDGVDATRVVADLRERFGITIANGQGELKGKIVRIGHIGWFDVFDITTALAALELALADAGAEIERGVAVTRALEAYAERAHV